MKGARIAINTCMGVKPGEKVLIVMDPPRLKIAEALLQAAEEAGADARLQLMPVLEYHGQEPPPAVARAMKKADVVLAPTTTSLTHTQARLGATRAGVRIATMPMITEEMMATGAMLADYRKVAELTKDVGAILDRGEEVRVKAPGGTDITFSLGRRISHKDTGIYHRPGDFGNLPAGEAFIAPVEGSANGRVVVDGAMEKVSGEVELIVENGTAKKILGENVKELNRLLDRIGPAARNFAEFGIGTNYKARLVGNVLEGEKVLGTCHIALGDNSTFGGNVRAGIHIDGIFLKPTVEIDGKLLMKNGKLFA